MGECFYKEVSTGTMCMTKGERRILQALENDSNKELEEFVPGGWWIDTDRIDGRIGKSLLRKCFIKVVYEGKDCWAYKITEWGQEALKDPNWKFPKLFAEAVVGKQNFGSTYG